MAWVISGGVTTVNFLCNLGTTTIKKIILQILSLNLFDLTRVATHRLLFFSHRLVMPRNVHVRKMLEHRLGLLHVDHLVPSEWEGESLAMGWRLMTYYGNKSAELNIIFIVDIIFIRLTIQIY